MKKKKTYVKDWIKRKNNLKEKIIILLKKVLSSLKTSKNFFIKLCKSIFEWIFTYLSNALKYGFLFFKAKSNNANDIAECIIVLNRRKSNKYSNNIITPGYQSSTDEYKKKKKKKFFFIKIYFFFVNIPKSKNYFKKFIKPCYKTSTF